MQKYNLTKIQRCILALLEEAGNENVATLINTAIRNSGRRNEVQAIQEALQGLLKHELIQIAKFDKRADQWVSYGEKESAAFLRTLESQLSWSDSKKIWAAQEGSASLEVMLTEVGTKEACEILKKDGYPEPNSILISSSKGSE